MFDRAAFRNLFLWLVTLISLSFTAFVGWSLLYDPEVFDPPIGGGFTLSDSDGQSVNDRDLRGGYMLIYFGYTHCPDLCPTQLSEMSGALDAFDLADPARAARVTPLFVTVDPERDTPAALGAYITHFHPRFRALSGSLEATAALLRAYNAYARKVPSADGQDYLVDHTGYVYLMGPDGRYLTHFPAKATAARILGGLERLVARSRP